MSLKYGASLRQVDKELISELQGIYSVAIE